MNPWIGFLFFALLLTSAAQAAESGGAKSRIFGVAGLYLPSPAYVSQDERGGTSIFSPANVTLGPRGTLALSKVFQLESALGFVLPWRKNIDGNQTYRTLLMSFDMGCYVQPKVEVFSGVAFSWTRVSGSSSTVVQRNGTSSATFYTPNAAESIWVGGLDFGVAFFPTDSLRLAMDVTVWQFLSSTRRRTSLLFEVGYAFF